MTHTGKIARLPREIREELNRRLRDGERGRKLIAWLNGLPEVRAVLARDFGGHAISEQNFSQWKQGGYQRWLTQQEALAQARELRADAEELTEATNGQMADDLATVLTARLAAVLADWNGEADTEFQRKLRPLRALCEHIVELRRGAHSAARLKIEQKRLESEQEKTEEEIVEHFQRWARYPKVREWICEKCLSPEEKQRRIREIFGMEPEAAANRDGSSNPDDDTEKSK